MLIGVVHVPKFIRSLGDIKMFIYFSTKYVVVDFFVFARFGFGAPSDIACFELGLGCDKIKQILQLGGSCNPHKINMFTA